MLHHFFVLAAAVAIAAPCRAQSLTFTSAPASFGEECAILGDLDGGGRRDLLIGSPTSDSCRVISCEGGSNPPTLIGTPLFGQAGTQFGRALANVGNVGGDAREDFAIAVPNLNTFPAPRGEVWILGFLTGGTNFAFLRILTGPLGFGSSLAVLTGQPTANGNALAVGSPGTNQVMIYDPNNGALLRTLDVNTPTGTLGGGLGTSMAAGPGNVLAVGAPQYLPFGTGGAPHGYVAIYDLNLPGVFPRSFLYRGLTGELLGSGVASVGQLPGNPTSTLSDFAVLGRGAAGVPARLFLFHTPSGFSTTPTVTAALTTLPSPNPVTVATDGRLVRMGDVDGDEIGDCAVTWGGLLHVMSTAGNVFTILHQQNASTNAGLASGPDVFRMGTTRPPVPPTVPTEFATDLVLGTPNINPTTGNVRVLELATSVSLPNNTNVRLSPLGARPIIQQFQTSPFTLRVTAPTGQFCALLVDLAPPFATPFGPDTAYVSSTGGAVTLTFQQAPFNFTATLPAGFQFLYQGLVFQAVGFGSTLVPSNGILARLGAF